jgi:5-methyltetrahydrofolate--homocysteine methyltransferase
MDGAMGTELQRAGIGPGECYELWNLTHPDAVRAIQLSYVQAGAEVLLTHTFQANPVALERYGLQNQIGRMLEAAVALARSAGGPDRFVLGDIGPVKLLDQSAAREMLRYFQGVDALLFETCSDVAGLEPFLEANSGDLGSEALPVLVSWTFQRTREGLLRTEHGDAPEACARRVADYPIAGLGVNCGRDIGMEETIAILRRYRQATDLPLFARPNAGTPTRQGERWVYLLTPEQMADRLPELPEAGIAMVGGCCGTTPAHIAAMRPVIEKWNERPGRGS